MDQERDEAAILIGRGEDCGLLVLRERVWSGGVMCLLSAERSGEWSERPVLTEILRNYPPNSDGTQLTNQSTLVRSEIKPQGA